ncbi:hypothetical protein RND81_03G142800 [Saponaria officinalis]|uniref:DUF4408 domain-containing protein n=1 Tax=Saponaria officinalis TaxID=3572 RepID=A0AAW1M903_SAPOF
MFDDAISMLSIIWSSLNSWFTPTFLFLFLNLMIGTIFITSSFSSSPKNPHPTDSAALHHHHPPQQQPQQPPSHLNRAPSLLHRLKSINFYSYSSQGPSQQNLSSTSDPFPEGTPELGLQEKVPARVQTQTRAQVYTQARAVPELRLGKASAQVQNWAAQVPIIEEDIPDDEGPTLDEIYNRIKGTTTHQHNRHNSDTIPANGDIPMKLPAKMKKSASEKSAFNHFETDMTDENANITAAALEEMEMISAAMATTACGGTEVDAMADDFINRFKKELQLQRNESILRYKDMIIRGGEK